MLLEQSKVGSYAGATELSLCHLNCLLLLGPPYSKRGWLVTAKISGGQPAIVYRATKELVGQPGLI